MRACDPVGTSGTYRHLGLTFSSPWRLGIAQATTKDPDVKITRGVLCDVPDSPPSGEIVAERRLADAPAYTIVRDQGRYVLRMHGWVEFVVSDDGSRVECNQDRECPEGLVEGHLVATVTALLLAVRGFAVLHASCVAINGRAVAFVGPQGAWKSTCAGLCAVAGASFVADDVLAITTAGGEPPVEVVGRASELRLRQESEWLAAALGGSLPTRRTVDGRLAVRLGGEGAERLPLAGIIVPRYSTTIDSPSMQRLHGQDAFFALATESRLSGLRDPWLHEQLFTAVSTVAGELPVMTLSLPLVTRLDSGLADAVYTASSSLVDL